MASRLATFLRRLADRIDPPMTVRPTYWVRLDPPVVKPELSDAQQAALLESATSIVERFRQDVARRQGGVL